jgi:hypothetical protein
MKDDTAIEQMAKQIKIFKLYAAILTLVLLSFIGYVLTIEI